MPIIFEEDEILGSRLQLDPIHTDTPGIKDTVKAAFATENSVGSLLSRGPSDDLPLVPLDEAKQFNPFDDIKGYEDFADSFIEADSPERLTYIKSEIDREKENRGILAASGWPGVVSQIAAGTLDPLFLPFLFFPAANVVRTGTLRSAVEFAVAGGAGAAVSEAGLHQTQETRTSLESTFNITGATLLSGMLGAAASALSKQQFKELSDLVSKDFADELPNTSIGASATRSTTIADETLVGAAGVEKATAFMSPLLRTMQSPSKATRQVVQDLAENAFFTAKNVEGKATSTAVETLIKQHDARVGLVMENLDSMYVQYRQGASKTGVAVKDIFGSRRKSGDLSYREFREAVGRAMRRGDVHAIPQVEQAAKFIRRILFDPHKKAAQELKLLPENVIAKGADSYLSRVYNIEKIKAEYPQFKSILSDWITRKSGNTIERVEADGIADDIIANIMGTEGGLIPRDIVPHAGPLKDRVLDIEDSAIESFLESDIEVIARFYNRTMAPEIELTRRFGSKDMKAEIDIVRNEFEILKKNANPGESKKLQKAMEDDIRDILALRDLLIGTYRTPLDASSFFTRAGKVTREINYLRLLGGMTISAIPDLARPIMIHGLRRTAKALGQLAFSPKKFKLAAKEVKQAGAAWDMVLNTRANAIADIGDIYGMGSKFERGLKAMTQTFGIPSLMAPWNAAMKQFSGVITASRILEESLRMASGKISKANIRKLAQSGIDEQMAKRIAKMFKAHGEDTDVLLSRSAQWTDREAARVFNAAVLKDVDTIIVTPGVGDKPLWMSYELGKSIGQFKSFAFASANRVLIAGLQQRDAAALNGLLLSVGLGAVVYGLKQTVAGREVSDDPAVLITEAIDRSGLHGYFGDIHNIIEKATRGAVGVSALTGGPQMSRYASRNFLGAIAGPTGDAVNDMAQVIGAISTQDIKDADVRALRKLLPYQNLFYIRNLLNKMEEGVADAVVTK